MTDTTPGPSMSQVRTDTAMSLDPERLIEQHRYSAISSSTGNSSQSQTSRQTKTIMPTLKKVLARRSDPPVCLYNFYLYMRDHEHAQHYLDFWLDVITHENRCKVYCKNIIRASKRFSTIGDGSSIKDRASWRLSIRDISNELRFSMLSQQTANASVTELEVAGDASLKSDASGSHRYRVSKQSDQASTVVGQTATAEGATAAGTTDTAAMENVKKPIKREEIQRSARKLYRRYFVAGGRRELPFPDYIRQSVMHAVEVEGRDDPEVFQEAKGFVFQVMDQRYFPRFIQQRSKYNISPRQALIRLVLGLFMLFIGFTTVLSLIFLNRIRRLRWYSLIPITVAVILLFSYLARFCPILTLFRTTEISFMKFAQVKDTFTLRRHRIKALWLFLSAIITSLAIVGVFMALPGYRL